MRYLATHLTRYRYQDSVAQCLTEARLVPRTLPHQRVIETKILVNPEPAVFEERLDYFGNRVTFFSVFETHQEFTVTSQSTVEVDAVPAPPVQTPWEECRERAASTEEAASIEASEYLFDSPYVAGFPALAAYAEPSFPAGRSLVDAVKHLSSRIYKEFQYRPHSTDIDMPLPDVFRRRRGVCQDFAHIMIGALRAWRLPARYVSGYLRSGSQFQGAEASHAWVSVFIPDHGWFDLDPTNNVLPSDRHVTLAWGRDYGDVTPVKGIALGGGGQKVDVEVSVKPVDVS